MNVIDGFNKKFYTSLGLPAFNLKTDANWTIFFINKIDKIEKAMTQTNFS